MSSSRWPEEIDELYGLPGDYDVRRRYRGLSSYETCTPEMFHLTKEQFDRVLVTALQLAAEHADQVAVKHAERQERFTPGQRVGIFCTSLRSGLISSNVSNSDNHTLLMRLYSTDTWLDILLPRKEFYGTPAGHIKFSNGTWTMDHDKIKALADMARGSHPEKYRDPLHEPSLSDEIAVSFSLVERSIPTLNALAGEAARINAQSSLVVANMLSIAESLQR